MNKIILILVTFLAVSNIASAQHDHNHSHGERVSSKGVAAMDNKGHFAAYDFTRHAVGDNDILIDIMYAGICHSDIHTVLGHWGEVMEYPMIPGHEIAGRVVEIGKNVTKFKVGDYAGVGCMVNSCGECKYCLAGQEQYCEKGMIGTYGAADRFHDNEMTQGGYSNNIVVSEDFGILIPQNADMEKVAPPLCAGITTYSPIKKVDVKKGDKVGIAGFGGLGHMAVQYAVALGADVTVFDITEDKRDLAMEMGAKNYVNVNDPKQLEGLKNSFDFILSTIPFDYDLKMYLDMVDLNGDFIIVGVPAFDGSPSIDVTSLVFKGGRNVAGSMIGGIKETQEMIDYSVANNIYPMVQVIDPTAANVEDAYQNVMGGNVHFRYVIDMSKL